MKLYEIVVHQLKKAPQLVADNGELKKWVIIDLARNYDPELLKLLVDHPQLKEAFFVEVDGILVFKQEKFISFLEMKNYLNDSYTKYKNKVGFIINHKFLNQNNEVALVWPFKDCLLEGGQSREEQKKDEIFFNELLAQDEITQLLEPKVLTNAKVYDIEGEHRFKSFTRDAALNRKRELPLDTITDNLIIKGNNLLALHSLIKVFAAKVKLIYIDPPYNTGNDGFNYNDSFNQSTWLTFIKNRLEVAKALLHNDGAIFVQCDDHEQAYLKVLMDEVFGKENYRETIVVKTSTPSGVNAVNVKRGERLFKVKEYLLFYSKNPTYRFKPIYVKSNFNKNYRYEVKKVNNKYHVKDLKKVFKSDAELEEYVLKNPENIYSLEKNNKKAGEKIKAVIRQSQDIDDVIEYTNNFNQKVLVYKKGVFIPLKERLVKDNGKYYFGTLISDMWDDEIFQTNQNEGGVNLPGGKKPEKLLKRIIELTTNENDIVLDYHLGSGTTAAVAHKMNRQYIGVEQLDYKENDSVVRLQKVINGDPTGISKTINWQGGGSFTYLELKKYNQNFIESIASSTSTEELLKIWNQMKERSFLNYNVDIQRQDAAIQDFTALSLAEQKQFLFEILDKNQLYVNLSSLYDKDFKCTTNEIEVTKNFYNL